MTDSGIRRLALGTLLGVLPGTVAPEATQRLLAEGLAGFTLFAQNIADPQQLRRLTDSLRAVRSDVLVAVDEEGGDVTRLAHAIGSPYPGNAALGEVGSPALTRRIYRAIGADLAAAGLNLNLAPTVDVNTADNSSIIGTRSFGAEPALVTAHTTAAVLGLQEAGVAACVKHYPGHGATLEDSHLSLPTVDASLPLLRSRDLPPFAAAVGVGTKAIMTAHIRVPELTGDDPATFSPAAINLLREEYEFDGVILSDALEMAGAANTAGGLGAAAVRSLAAGADLLCFGPTIGVSVLVAIVDGIVAAVSAGMLPVVRLEQAAGRTAALAAWVAGEATAARCEPDQRSDLGFAAARRALRVEGSVAGLASPLVVQLQSQYNIAEGRVPWGPASHLAEGSVVRVDAGNTSPEQLRQLAGDRPVALVGRYLHGSPAATALIDKLAAGHPCIVVEMGWPSSWRPGGARAFVTTHGASRAHGAAVAELLGLG